MKSLTQFALNKAYERVEKLDDKLTYPLQVFKNKKDETKTKNIYKTLKSILLEKIENWKQYKPIRGKI